MARNVEPIFIGLPLVGIATVYNESVVRAPADAATLGLLVDAGANGALIESISAVPLGNNALTVLRIFYQPEDGIPSLCLPEIVLPLINTASENAALQTIYLDLPKIVVGDVGTKALRLAPNARLWAGISNTVASGYNIIAVGGFY